MSSNETEEKLKMAVLLTKIIDELHEANEKLDLLVNSNSKLLETYGKLLKTQSSKKSPASALKLEPDAMALLSLPMSLRKTVMVLYKLEKATATEIAKETKRLRAVESASANQLARLGYLRKERKGRDVYFYIEQPLETER
jgi:hypothetical protein